MRKITAEILIIVIISLLLSLISHAISPAGIKVFKKAPEKAGSSSHGSQRG